ncbi:MAG: hypothetical protein NTZ59_08855, partial [Bacteroidetes bacterium]|nr:hypothetical protein [Bacteroidota bacterium]
MLHYCLKSKAYLVCFAFIFITTNTLGQKNLVPNYSFEQYTVCPNVLGYAPIPPPWYLTCRSYFAANYLNACANGSSSNYGVPLSFYKTAWNYQPAHTGQAYVLIDYLFSSHQTLQCPLLDSMRKNKKYYCEFYVNQPQMMKYSCNNHGMLFTNTAIFPDTVGEVCGLLQVNPHITNYGNPIISDTVNWVKVSGIYKAQGGEKYISIGNFNTWQNTNFIQTNPLGGAGASYLIDNVSVIPLDSMCLKADAGKDTTIKVGDSVFIGSHTNGIDTIKWYNTNGQLIDSVQPGFWVKPTSTGTSFYVLQQTVNGCYSSDTIYVNVVLPLRMMSYELRMMNERQVMNKWETMNEINVSHYNIERSLNAKDFVTIGKVKANNTSFNQYNFT